MEDNLERIEIQRSRNLKIQKSRNPKIQRFREINPRARPSSNYKNFVRSQFSIIFNTRISWLKLWIIGTEERDNHHVNSLSSFILYSVDLDENFKTDHLTQAIICLEISTRSGRWSIRTFVQPPRNNNLSVYVSRCKQSSNQSQPIVILMLVRLNGKSVYRSFLSLSHTRTLSFSFTSSIGPNEQFDTIQSQILYSFSFLFLFSIISIFAGPH